ncbi:hypothetical protein ACW2QC_06135 [Virgibacillus sp. FSP13]
MTLIPNPAWPVIKMIMMLSYNDWVCRASSRLVILFISIAKNSKSKEYTASKDILTDENALVEVVEEVVIDFGPVLERVHEFVGEN